jgi:uroporphyrinogen-III synthase
MLEAMIDSKNARTRNPIGAPLESRARAKPEALDCDLDEVRELVDELVAGRHEVLIFMTGNSVSSLFELAQELDRHEELVTALETVTTACRGPKAAAVLRGFGLQPTLGERGLFTTPRLIYALSRLELAGRSVVRLNGAPSDAIANRLRAQHVRLREFSIQRRSPTKASMR